VAGFFSSPEHAPRSSPPFAPPAVPRLRRFGSTWIRMPFSLWPVKMQSRARTSCAILVWCYRWTTRTLRSPSCWSTERRWPANFRPTSCCLGPHGLHDATWERSWRRLTVNATRLRANCWYVSLWRWWSPAKGSLTSDAVLWRLAKRANSWNSDRSAAFDGHWRRLNEVTDVVSALRANPSPGLRREGRKTVKCEYCAIVHRDCHNRPLSGWICPCMSTTDVLATMRHPQHSPPGGSTRHEKHHKQDVCRYLRGFVPNNECRLDWVWAVPLWSRRPTEAAVLSASAKLQGLWLEGDFRRVSERGWSENIALASAMAENRVNTLRGALLASAGPGSKEAALLTDCTMRGFAISLLTSRRVASLNALFFLRGIIPLSCHAPKG